MTAMPSDDYKSAGGGGALKLKGAGAKVKKHKKKKDKAEGGGSDLEKALSTGGAGASSSSKTSSKDKRREEGSEEAGDDGSGSAQRPVAFKTEAERRFEEARRKKVCLSLVLRHEALSILHLRYFDQFSFRGIPTNGGFT